MRLGDFVATSGTGHLVQQALAGGHRVRTVVRDTAGPDRPGPDVRAGAAPTPDATFRTALAEPAAIGHSIFRGY
ncbi:hypothetical protein [Nocardia testacea]|uniref:hypothetical protein n=1 Tax=Nocardia testacea TaxID=248551 RepID=UPI0002EA357F|nr:hypothetical protein [Nocardia testacea]